MDASDVKICFLMWYDKNHKEFGDINYKINKAYCDKHGYDIIRDSQRRMRNREPNFERIALAKKYLPHYDYVIWLDADAYFYIDSPPIDLVINDYSEFDFILSSDQDEVPESEHHCEGMSYGHTGHAAKINSGFFIVKNTAYSMETLDLWGFDGHFYKAAGGAARNGGLGLFDQGVLRLLHLRNVSQFQEHSVLLPFGFLQIYLEEQRFYSQACIDLLLHYNVKKEFIYHNAGKDKATRVGDSKNYYNLHISGLNSQ
tara:strand:- start:381 stop:1151 length:771 start_codon:yes stop_codon:yes gene_type:complete